MSRSLALIFVLVLKRLEGGGGGAFRPVEVVSKGDEVARRRIGGRGGSAGREGKFSLRRVGRRRRGEAKGEPEGFNDSLASY